MERHGRVRRKPEKTNDKQWQSHFGSAVKIPINVKSSQGEKIVERAVGESVM